MIWCSRIGLLGRAALLLAVLALPASLKAAEPLREWTIMVYSATANDLEPYTFRDVAKLTASRPKADRPVALSMLIATINYGDWQLAYDGDPEAITLRRLDRLRLYDLGNLTRFIRETAAKLPARKYALIMQGHGSGWYFSIEPGHTVSSAAVASAIRKAGVPFEIIGLDMCLMSSLETAWKFRQLTPYLIACEDYGPWEGITSPETISEFSSVRSTRALLSRMATSFIRRNNPDPDNDPADISVIATAGVEPLTAFVEKAFQGRSLDRSYFDLTASVDRSATEPYPYLQDLYTLTMRVLKDEPAEQRRFQELFRATVIDYQQDRQKEALPYAADHHGLSIAVNALGDPTDVSHRYREMTLPVRLKTEKSPTR
jgi:hypothetical protein